MNVCNKPDRMDGSCISLLLICLYLDSPNKTVAERERERERKNTENLTTINL